jgi:pilus assembly protein TadC
MELQPQTRGEEIFMATVAIVLLCVAVLVVAGSFFHPPLFGEIGDFCVVAGVIGPSLPFLLVAFRVIAARFCMRKP